MSDQPHYPPATAPERSLPPPGAAERDMLAAFLDFQRATLAVKCAGLPAELLRVQAVPPSGLSLLGLVRHMAEVERSWFRIRFAEADQDHLYQTPDDPDADFNGALADPLVVEQAMQAWHAEMAFADEFIADHDFDFVGKASEGEPVSLRELIVHMIQEYARHNGHADLLRERIDGRVGQ